ncbi:hypothetical protein FXF51_50060 [Nonomuraea sp. PA05]|uniref:hypothetical protein n=1 Tax=Nonomuraea sp. PA05 TaxID=2604466 RepID=UPI0011DBC340|nr:hypothetical protein [Nonomuraea sp. PA05]TYB53231.1 hypothetical protein FXF51_50060 [Nonomuraea sp. PA05]
MVDDERTPSPDEMLRLIEEQSAATTRWIYGDPLLLYVPWGVAWALGFTALFLHYGLDGHPYAPISQMQAVGVLMVAQVVAGGISALGFVRLNQIVRGDSKARGTMFGYAWFAGFTLMTVLCNRISPHLPAEESGLLWAGSSLMLVAALQMAGGAVFLNWPMFFFGVFIGAVNALGLLLGAGWHALLTAALLGGGFIAVGVALRLRS